MIKTVLFLCATFSFLFAQVSPTRAEEISPETRKQVAEVVEKVLLRVKSGEITSQQVEKVCKKVQDARKFLDKAGHLGSLGIKALRDLERSKCEKAAKEIAELFRLQPGSDCFEFLYSAQYYYLPAVQQQLPDHCPQ